MGEEVRGDRGGGANLLARILTIPLAVPAIKACVRAVRGRDAAENQV